MPHPISVNALEFAKQMLEIHGRIRASHFSGVQDALFLGKDDASEVQYELRGERGHSNKYALRLVISGRLSLLCQRCLGEMEYELHHSARFELVASEADLPADDTEGDLQDDQDEIDYLVADTELDVEQLIGQELLLALPLAPKHENALCSSAVTADTEQKPNPFSVLQGLKRDG